MRDNHQRHLPLVVQLQLCFYATPKRSTGPRFFFFSLKAIIEKVNKIDCHTNRLKSSEGKRRDNLVFLRRKLMGTYGCIEEKLSICFNNTFPSNNRSKKGNNKTISFN
jgi:hypothetical protein